MKELILLCPHCNQPITIQDIKNHDGSWSNLESYVSTIINEERDSLKREILEKLSREKDEKFKLEKDLLNDRYKAELKDLENQWREKIAIQSNNYEKENDQLKNEIRKLNEQSELQLIAAKQNIDLEYNKQINALKNEINVKNEAIDNFKVELEDKIKIAYQEAEKQHFDKVAEINVELVNKENEIHKMKESLDAQLRSKEQEVSLKFEQQLRQIMLQKQSLESELKNLETRKDVEINRQMRELDLKYRIEIEDLKIANAQNKILQSKRKGENFEHEVEGDLRKAFGDRDVIEKITTGDKKADYLQSVVDPFGNDIGKIMYEVKNAKWQNTWIQKLSADMASRDTKYGILVSTYFNDKYHGVPFVKSSEFDNIWITDSESFVFVAQIIRKLIENEFQLKSEIKALIDNGERDAVIEQYLKKEKELSTFAISDLPIIMKSFTTELTTIDHVKNSLVKNANKLEKSHEVLENKIKNIIDSKLKEILEIA